MSASKRDGSGAATPDELDATGAGTGVTPVRWHEEPTATSAVIENATSSLGENRVTYWRQAQERLARSNGSVAGQGHRVTKVITVRRS